MGLARQWPNIGWVYAMGQPNHISNIVWWSSWIRQIWAPVYSLVSLTYYIGSAIELGRYRLNIHLLYALVSQISCQILDGWCCWIMWTPIEYSSTVSIGSIEYWMGYRSYVIENSFFSPWVCSLVVYYWPLFIILGINLWLWDSVL